jgi:hypothetical protein
MYPAGQRKDEILRMAQTDPNLRSQESQLVPKEVLTFQDRFKPDCSILLLYIVFHDSCVNVILCLEAFFLLT